MNYLKQKYWSPYIVGIGIAILSLITVYYFNTFIGVSSAFEQLGICMTSVCDASGFINWKTIFVISIFFGALAASRLSGAQQTDLPSIWTKTFGDSKQKRYFAAFFGGILVLLGARIAGGCTSGHAISGTMKLAVTSWYFLFALFASGVITSFILYKR